MLADISKNKAGTFKITVDGPISLFQQTKKYGLSLATFFPAVLHLSEWKLQADIHLRNRKPKRLVLDHHGGIAPLFRPFPCPYPRRNCPGFRRLFQVQETEWKIAPADDFIRLPGDAYGFADFGLEHPSGKAVGLECFHAWHGGPLNHRLKQLKDLEEIPPLLLGVDRKLAKDPAITARLEESSYFRKWGFLFREMPSPNAVPQVLESTERINYSGNFIVAGDRPLFGRVCGSPYSE